MTPADRARVIVDQYLNDGLINDPICLQNDIAQALSEKDAIISEIHKTLEFYASQELWEPKVIIPAGTNVSEEFSQGIIMSINQIDGDRGERARKALSKIEKTNV